ncbi:MAG TPA: FAD-binding oxidoreductase, partial [Trueperaceae bacterium]|nr:FAD-binding oxidoreductase [Trueperaceae bacterium]
MVKTISKGELDELSTELSKIIEGEVYFDDKHRSLYSTDSSPYQIKPYGVVLPKNTNDVKKVVALANKYDIAILPRGGGTSLAGQTVAEAIVLDFSKYFTNILEFNNDEQWVKVQSGVVRDQLNKYLAPYKLQFTPDVATTSR